VRTLTTLAALGAALLLAGCANPCPDAEPVTRPGTIVPVYKTICEPIYEERRTPVWGHKTVPVFQDRCKPVSIQVPVPFSECEKTVDLWSKTEQVQVGVTRVPACIGYRTEKVQVGTCAKRVRVGWRTVGETTCP
jgi:hypothetical protein